MVADADIRPKVVGGHELKRLASEDARAAERAAEIEHLREPRVIVHRRDKPAAAHFETRFGPGVEELHGCAAVGIVRERLGEALVRVRARGEAGIAHAQRRKNSLMQKRAQGLPGDNLDDAADDVGGMAVIPGCARLVEQRQLGERNDKFGESGTVRAKRRRAYKLRLDVKALHGRNTGEKVRQPRCVAQQVLDGDRPLGRDQFELAILFDADFGIGKFRARISPAGR